MRLSPGFWFAAFLLMVTVGCLGMVTYLDRATDPPASRPLRAVTPPEPLKRTEPPEHKPEIAVVSRMAREEALGDQHFPQAFLDAMEVVPVRYIGFDGRVCEGQIVVNRAVADEVREVFDEILDAKCPIEKVVPIVAYGWDDDASIADNNTSGFNYRNTIGPGLGSRLSNHSYGRAIDVNPYQNPYLDAHGEGPRPYDPAQKGTITHASPIYKAFIRHGWKWGGDWKGGKDYQHFEKLDISDPLRAMAKSVLKG
ncbi:hypothetical protein BH11ARM2_BH11ARM2_26610 [soil metagenome]